MDETLNWDDLRLYLAVARNGGLAGAVPTTQLSAPTLSRRMISLECALGLSLFIRRRDGYGLTGAGKELLDLAEAVEQGILGIERWRSAVDPHPVVKIAAGAWTSIFIAGHLPGLIDVTENLSLEILTGTATAALLRREANIGLRNRKPETPGLAGKRLVRVEFAVYGRKSLIANHSETTGARRFEASPWIAFSPPGPKTPSAVWLDRHLHRSAQIKCSTAQTVIEVALSGFGFCVLPCFIGDAESGLERASGVIAELGHDQWLVSHDDDRHSKPIKLVSRKLAGLIQSHQRLFSGQI